MTYNFHSSCKHMHLSFKMKCNKEHKGVICNTTSLSYSSQSTRPFGKNYSSFLDFTGVYNNRNGPERTGMDRNAPELASITGMDIKIN